MYMSRVELNIRRRETMRALSSPEIIHSAVESGFPRASEQSRNLWRIDVIAACYWLYVLSRQKPDLTHIVEQFGWPAHDQKWETKDYKPFLDQIKKGQAYRFRLCANPVYTVKENGKNKSYAHVTAGHRRKWLLDRSNKNGFLLCEDFGIVDNNIKRFKHEKSKITINIVTFEGHLVVTDEELFKNTLISGIGRSRAYGCGLLTLIQIK